MHRRLLATTQKGVFAPFGMDNSSLNAFGDFYSDIIARAELKGVFLFFHRAAHNVRNDLFKRLAIVSGKS